MRSTFPTSLLPISSPRCAAPVSLMLPPLGDETFKYAFMLPTATAVATSCQLAGIGGAALFSPIFLLIFPLLGPQYPLASPAAAIASALLTEVFGFTSGLSGFARRVPQGLVDWSVAVQFASVSVPAALAGALGAGVVASNVTALRGVYAALMLGLSAYLILGDSPEATAALAEDECAVPVSESEATGRQIRTKGEYRYLSPARGSASSTSATLGGGLITGLLGVGIGEVVLPQLVRGCCMPLPVAAGTSVGIVVVTALTAAAVQFAALAAATGGDLVSVVPWPLVQWTIPGVLIGGQIAPLVASRGVLSDESIETFAASLFGVVGLAFAAKALQGPL